MLLELDGMDGARQGDTYVLTIRARFRQDADTTWLARGKFPPPPDWSVSRFSASFSSCRLHYTKDYLMLQVVMYERK
jgi:hypothetical protein